jgi:hypothetical protein
MVLWVPSGFFQRNVSWGWVLFASHSGSSKRPDKEGVDLSKAPKGGVSELVVNFRSVREVTQ